MKLKLFVSKISYVVDAKDVPKFVMEFAPDDFLINEEVRQRTLQFLDDLVHFPRDIKSEFWVEVPDENPPDKEYTGLCCEHYNHDDSKRIYTCNLKDRECIFPDCGNDYKDNREKKIRD